MRRSDGEIVQLIRNLASLFETDGLRSVRVSNDFEAMNSRVPDWAAPSSRIAIPRDLVRGALRALWALVRLPLLALLGVLEPLVRVLLAGGALLMTLTAIFFVLVQPISTFPFWGMLGLAAGLVLLLSLYYALLRLLSL
jgi:hypothetical protein